MVHGHFCVTLLSANVPCFEQSKVKGLILVPEPVTIQPLQNPLLLTMKLNRWLHLDLYSMRSEIYLTEISKALGLLIVHEDVLIK